MQDNIIILFSCATLIIGAVECFAGFKIMKAMMAVWGIFMGAFIGTLIGIIAKSALLGIAAALLLCIGLAILVCKIHIAGIFIHTAFITTLAFYVIFDTLIGISVLLGMAAGVSAIFFVKPAVLISSAFSGAGIILGSAYKMARLEMGESPWVKAILWIPISLAGIAVQYITTQNRKKRKSTVRPKAAAAEKIEGDYEGMQKAYRNFCIMCGFGLSEKEKGCPQCGFSFED